MNDLPRRLASALADRYRIERELGAGWVPKSGGAQQGASTTTATLRYLVTLNWFDELRRQLAAQRR